MTGQTPKKPKPTSTVGPIGPAGPMQRGLQVGDLVEVEVGSVAHGGHCVARHDGRVVFVRHALPGERVLLRITEVKKDSFCRADAVDILRPSAERVEAPCIHYGPGLCGGCDFQHASAGEQRMLKGEVVAEQLRRLAGITREVQVQPLTGDGFGWRTRVRWAADRGGRVGPRAGRSHDVVPVTAAAPCLIAAEGLAELAGSAPVTALLRSAAPVVTRKPARGRGPAPQRAELPELALTAAGDGSAHAVLVGGAPGRAVVETVHGREFAVAADGFWQVHPAAAQTLVDAVLAQLPDLTGGSAWDLYGGVGLFAAFLAERVGPTGRVITVELEGSAAEFARQNLSDLPQVEIRPGRVDAVLADLPPGVDAVVLDPPRTGAGREVCEAITARRPATIVYVACDPAALARDTATLEQHGYRLADLVAFDAFPQTHHVECVAQFLPA